MTEEQMQRLAAQLEPQVREFISNRLTAMEIDPLDGVRIMQLTADYFVEHMTWLIARLN